MTAADRAESYGRAALAGLVADLAAAPDGERNGTLNRVALRAARLAAAGALSWESAAGELEAAALARGLDRHEVAATMRSAYRAGSESPATIPEGKPGDRRRSPARPPLVRREPPEQGPPPRPPRAEVEALWRLARPVTEDGEVSAYLASRAITPERVELCDLARALPVGARVPRWASCRRIPWSVHHRMVVRGWGASGAVESLHARAIGESPAGLPKGLWPAAGPGSARGLVLAEGWARQILAMGQRPEGWCGELVVAEGVPDFLSWATTCSDADQDAPAVLGLTAGSWTPELSARVPDGTRAILATHSDAAGDRYAATVAATFQGRKVEVRRWKA